MLHTITLTRRGQRTLRDVQAAHGLTRHLTGGAPHQWVQVARDTLIIRTATAELDTAPEHVHAVTTAVEPPTPPTGTPIRYAARIHPVRRHGSHETPLHGDDIRDWAHTKLSDALNLHPDTLTIQEGPPHTGTRWGRRVIIHTAAITGTATVRDRDTLTHLLSAGIGRAKAYGQGLLLTTPLGATP